MILKYYCIYSYHFLPIWAGKQASKFSLSSVMYIKPRKAWHAQMKWTQTQEGSKTAKLCILEERKR